MAEEFKGIFVLEGQPEREKAALKVDRYGLRILWGFWDEAEFIVSANQSPVYLTGKAFTHLKKLTEDVWQCSNCLRWNKGLGKCSKMCRG